MENKNQVPEQIACDLFQLSKNLQYKIQNLGGIVQNPGTIVTLEDIQHFRTEVEKFKIEFEEWSTITVNVLEGNQSDEILAKIYKVRYF